MVKKKEKAVKSPVVAKAAAMCSRIGQRCRTRCSAVLAAKAAGLIGVMALVALGMNVWTENRVVILEADRVTQEVTAFKLIRAEEGKYVAQWNAETDVEVRALQAEQDELNKEKSKLSAAQYKKKQEALAKKIEVLKRKNEYRVRQIAAASRQAALSIQKEMGEAIKRVAKREHAGIILNSSNVIYADDETNNITDALIKEMNKAITSVTYPNPLTFQFTSGEK